MNDEQPARASRDHRHWPQYIYICMSSEYIQCAALPCATWLSLIVSEEEMSRPGFRGHKKTREAYKYEYILYI